MATTPGQWNSFPRRAYCDRERSSDWVRWAKIERRRSFAYRVNCVRCDFFAGVKCQKRTREKDRVDSSNFKRERINDHQCEWAVSSLEKKGKVTTVSKRGKVNFSVAVCVSVWMCVDWKTKAILRWNKSNLWSNKSNLEKKERAQEFASWKCERLWRIISWAESEHEQHCGERTLSVVRASRHCHYWHRKWRLSGGRGGGGSKAKCQKCVQACTKIVCVCHSKKKEEFSKVKSLVSEQSE